MTGGLLLLAPMGMATAQQATTGVAGSQATVYLSLNHPAHQTIELLRGAGLIPDAWLNRRPFTRREAATVLLAGMEAARREGLRVLADTAAWRLREFTDIAEAAETGLSPRRGPLRIDWDDGAGARLTAEMTLELGYDTREDISPDFKAAGTGRGGVEAYGTAGTAFGYAARYRQSSETREGSFKEWPHAPIQTIAQLRAFGEKGAAYTESSGHFSWDGRYFGADLRFDSPAWGPSPAYNLILSGHAPSFGHVQGRVAFGGWLQYAMIVGSLKSGIIDSSRSYQPDEPTIFRELERAKYIVGHRVDLRPFSTLQIGLTEAAIVGDRTPEMQYFVPTVSLWDSQHYLKDPDNTMIGLDIRWMPRSGPNLYGAIALDEWQSQSAFDKEEHHNWLAFQLGGIWTPPVADGRLNVWLEATRVLPNVYQHKYPVNDWLHADSPLGFWTGQNSEVIEGRVTWLFSGRLSSTLWGRYAQKGDRVDRIEQYRIPPAEEFLHGRQRMGAWVGASVTFEGEQHWLGRVEIVRAPKGLWPHSRDLAIIPSPPASLGQEWQIFFRVSYNPF
jgi:hypothetical protein